MKDPFFAPRNVFFACSLILLITGCGLKYEVPESLETLENSRREAIEANYSNAYKTRNKTYKPLTYGELVITKPESYRKLDSLYSRKYAQQQLGMSMEDIDAKIEIQKAVVFNDTNPVLYVETHWFELKDSSGYEFLIDRIAVTKTNQIVHVEQLDYFQCPNDLVQYARKYMLEHYFVSYYGEASDQELQFYKSYKEMASTLSGSEKQAFVEHTLRTMELAHKHSTLSTEFLLTKLAMAEIAKNDPSAPLTSLKYNVERILEERDGQDAFLNYRVSASIPGSDKAPLVFDYDFYLRPLR
jgi:hypothetical protein